MHSIWGPKELNSAKSWHVFHVYHDKEFIERAKSLKLYSPTSEMKKLGDDYSISIADVSFYLLSSLLPMKYHSEAKSKIEMDLKNKKFILKFDADVQISELKKKLREFDKMRRTLGILPDKSKKKPPEKTDLLYAIFKARRKGLTFGRIFKMYQNQELDGYTKIPTYKSEESLEKFYNRHRPDAY